jgi:hypothetical protein
MRVRERVCVPVAQVLVHFDHGDHLRTMQSCGLCMPAKKNLLYMNATFFCVREMDLYFEFAGNRASCALVIVVR